MLKHFITVGLRNIRRRGYLSVIQILGLALGIAAFVLIARYVDYERKWDTFNANSDLIYRIQQYERNDRSNVYTQTSPPLAAYLQQNISEIARTVTIDSEKGKFFSSSPKHTYRETRGYFATSDIFNVFSFNLLVGDKSSVLDRPDAIVLSKSMAEKYFPEEDPIGKTIFDREKNKLVVTGIMEDLPGNSSIQGSYFRSFYKGLINHLDDWDNNYCQTYVQLYSKTDAESINARIQHLLNDHIPLNKNNLYLHPLKEIHLAPDESGDYKSVVFFYSLIGILILLLAQVNFMNLSTSFSLTRSREIGVRKTMGSDKKLIRWQFLSESMLISLVSFFIALGFIILFLPFFNKVVNRNISITILNDFPVLLLSLGIVIITGFLSGTYPAFLASSYNPVKILKGSNNLSIQKKSFNGLTAMVYIQFVLSTLLLSSSIWMYKQVNFLKNKELGFKKEQLLHSRIYSDQALVSYQTLRKVILEDSYVNNMAISDNTPLHHSWGRKIRYEEGPMDELTSIKFNSACYDFIDTYQLKIIEGRDFSKDFETDRTKCIINETAVKQFGWIHPIGKWIEEGGEKYEVIGVLKDFHQDDTHNRIEPYFLVLHNKKLDRANCFTFLVNSDNINDTERKLQDKLTTYFPNSLFQIVEFDEDRNAKALNIWSNVRNTFGFFTLIAIFIAIVGIFGLVVFSTQRRIKELGIRKIHGASSKQVFSLVVNQFTLLLLIANINILPVFPLLEKYTPGVYKYHSTWLDFVLVAIATLLIVLVATCSQALIAATRNPVEALRYE